MIIFWIFPITIVNSHCECIYFVIMFHCVSPSKVEQNSLRSILKIPNMSVKNVILTILPIICNIMMKYCMLGNNKISLFICGEKVAGWSSMVWCELLILSSPQLGLYYIQSTGAESLLSKLAAQHLHKQRDQKSLWTRYFIHTTFQKIKLTRQKVISGSHFYVKVNVSQP